MAVKPYTYSCDNEKLGWLLSFCLSVVVSEDLRHFEMPGMRLLLDILYTERGVGQQDCVEFDFIPPSKGRPVDYVLVSYREPGDEAAGLYTYDEFAQGLYDELMRQSEGNTAERDKANKIIRQFELQRHASVKA